MIQLLLVFAGGVLAYLGIQTYLERRNKKQIDEAPISYGYAGEKPEATPPARCGVQTVCGTQTCKPIEPEATATDADLEAIDRQADLSLEDVPASTGPTLVEEAEAAAVKADVVDAVNKAVTTVDEAVDAVDNLTAERAAVEVEPVIEEAAPVEVEPEPLYDPLTDEVLVESNAVMIPIRTFTGGVKMLVSKETAKSYVSNGPRAFADRLTDKSCFAAGLHLYGIYTFTPDPNIIVGNVWYDMIFGENFSFERWFKEHDKDDFMDEFELIQAPGFDYSFVDELLEAATEPEAEVIEAPVATDYHFDEVLADNMVAEDAAPVVEAAAEPIKLVDDAISECPVQCDEPAAEVIEPEAVHEPGPIYEPGPTYEPGPVHEPEAAAEVEEAVEPETIEAPDTSAIDDANARLEEANATLEQASAKLEEQPTIGEAVKPAAVVEEENREE